MRLEGRNLLKEIDLTKEEFLYLVHLGAGLREEKRSGTRRQPLAGRNLALIFELASTRTRSAFEVAAHDLGAQTTFIGPNESHLGRKESTADTARVLGRMFDGIEYRGYSQENVEILGRHAGVPVWNGLTDRWHPTQSLADLRTMLDHSGGATLDAISVCYLGDAANNTCASLLTAGAMTGMDVRIAAPATRRPAPDVWEAAGRLAAVSGARLSATDDAAAAVAGADFVYTDVWLSLGEPAELWDERIDLLLPYQVNTAVLHATGNPEVKFLHCLPAMHNADTEVGRVILEKRGLEALEVTDEVFESSASVVWDQAENRTHAIKAAMLATIGD